MDDSAAAFASHCRAWNAGDRDGWLAVFSPDVILEDPVGALPKHGTAALETTWAASHRPGRVWRLEPRRVVSCGDEVAVDLVNRGTVDGAEVIVESIEVWRVDESGRVVSVRSFFAADPAVHDPWYLPVRPDETAGPR